MIPLALLLACTPPPAGDDSSPAPPPVETDDTACAPQTWYRDLDGDQHGDPADVTDACAAPDGYVATADDCAPRDATTWPGAPERCDGVDHDCDGGVNDDDAVEVTPWYADADADGYGVEPVVATACVAPASTVGRTGDCDDTNAAISPRAVEVCNGVDDDCDALADDADDWVSGGTSFWPDADADGYGDTDAAPTWRCAGTEGVADNAYDCDDTNPAVPVSFYRDDDADGYGVAPASSFGCTGAPWEVATAGDCDDADPTAYPGAPEPDCADPVDHNCDGAVGDGDGDGDGFAACAECDDGDPGTFPGATELCDGVDQDCDGVADNDAWDATTRYVDADRDTYGDPATETRVCGAPPGTVAVSGDCDDTVAAIHPGASEDCATAEDDNCDGDTNDRPASHCAIWYADDDGDGHGGADQACMCAATERFSATTSDDCDDDDPAIHPGVDDACGDDLDADCDGTDVCTAGIEGAATRYEGGWARIEAGTSLTCPGDADGDGVDDVLIGARGGYGRWEGVIQLAPLTAAGVYDLATAPVIVAGPTSAAEFGASDPAAVDADGDGLLDWWVGAGGYSDGIALAGAAWLVLGSSGSTDVASSAALAVLGDTRDDKFGSQVAAGSDLDADGVPDLLATKDRSWANAGVYLFPATDRGALTPASATLTVTGLPATLSTVSLLATDLDGDGADDLAVGSPGDDSDEGDGGRVYVFAGPLSGAVTLADADATWGSHGANDQAGHVLVPAGDTDGDGTDEVLVGSAADAAPYRVWLVREPLVTRSLADAPWSVGAFAPAGFGQEVLGDVDLDGDGGLDVAVAAPGSSGTGPAFAGVYLFRSPGTGTFTQDDADLALTEDGGWNLGGGAMASPGDLDGDGADELLVGSPQWSGAASQSGAVFVVSGRSLPW